MSSQDSNRLLFKEILPLVLDGEADENQRAFFYKQIGDCPNCRQLYEQENAIKQVIKTRVVRQQPPCDLLPTIQQQIQCCFSVSKT
jgi:predicted anti-sigma-YlaC factor YlaD